MKITSQEEYGLRCLLRLACGDEQNPLTIPEIANAEGLSAPYVAKLLGVLRQAGLIGSQRGRTGGYHLTRKPSAIGLGEVLLALGEPLFDDPGYCQRHQRKDRKHAIDFFHIRFSSSCFLVLYIYFSTIATA